ncbi:MAG: hypothetical protein NTY53_06795 [Kiritimatiellaeota bacterium]|nr:hypothetical protein [Kiritimatiellota bacterium]
MHDKIFPGNTLMKWKWLFVAVVLSVVLGWIAYDKIFMDRILCTEIQELMRRDAKGNFGERQRMIELKRGELCKRGFLVKRFFLIESIQPDTKAFNQLKEGVTKFHEKTFQPYQVVRVGQQTGFASGHPQVVFVEVWDRPSALRNWVEYLETFGELKVPDYE